MTDTINGGGPAFPLSNDNVLVGERKLWCAGLSVRQYAAIKLSVPDSGHPWLGDMIRTSNRDRLAVQIVPHFYTALASIRSLAWPPDFEGDAVRAALATNAYALADAVLKAGEGDQS